MLLSFFLVQRERGRPKEAGPEPVAARVAGRGQTFGTAPVAGFVPGRPVAAGSSAALTEFV